MELYCILLFSLEFQSYFVWTAIVLPRFVEHRSETDTFIRKLYIIYKRIRIYKDDIQLLRCYMTKSVPAMQEIIWIMVTNLQY